jgi:hypothetical protein
MPVAPVGPKECRKNALRCTELAENARDSKLKAVLKHLAEQWLKAAIELERAEGFAGRTQFSSKEAVGRLR